MYRVERRSDLCARCWSSVPKVEQRGFLYRRRRHWLSYVEQWFRMRLSGGCCMHGIHKRWLLFQITPKPTGTKITLLSRAVASRKGWGPPRASKLPSRLCASGLCLNPFLAEESCWKQRLFFCIPITCGTRGTVGEKAVGIRKERIISSNCASIPGALQARNNGRKGSRLSKSVVVLPTEPCYTPRKESPVLQSCRTSSSLNN
jgi:ubiquitin